MNKKTAFELSTDARDFLNLWHGSGVNDEDFFNRMIRVLNKLCQALEQPSQEPVALVYSMQDGYVGQMVAKGIPHKTKLYTHPHQWQGLTDDEIRHCLYDLDTQDFLQFARAIEQALKEKNNG